jgi:hypothetical protein
MDPLGPRLLSIRQKQLLGADIKEKRFSQINPAEMMGVKPKEKKNNNNESEWENCLQPGIFREKRSGFLFFFFFVISSSLRASVCVCCTLISIRTPGPLSFALPVFLVLY